MPGQRAPGQKLINVPVDEKFLTEIDAAIKQAGYDNRAEFIRDAIVEKLKNEGYPVTATLSKAPARFGKGGRPPLRNIHAERGVKDIASEMAKRGIEAGDSKEVKPIREKAVDAAVRKILHGGAEERRKSRS